MKYLSSKLSRGPSWLVLGLAFTACAGMASAQSYYRRNVRDFDQRRNALPVNGRNYCVPTSYADIFWYMAMDGGFGGLDRGYNGSYDGITQYIFDLGKIMDTDGDDGTNFDDGVEGAAAWIADHSNQFFVHSTLGPGSNWGTDRIRNTAAMGWMARLGITKYIKDGDEWDRDGGHAVALAGYDYRTSDKKVIVANPWTGDNDSLNNNSDRNLAARTVANHHITTEDHGYVAHARWRKWTKNGHSYQSFIDKMHIIMPMWAGWVNAPFTTTPPSASMEEDGIDTYSPAAWTFRAVFPNAVGDGTNPAVKERTIELPGPVKDWCMDPSQAAIYVLTTDGNVHHVDLLDKTTKKVTTVKGARKLAVAGRDFELFVLQDGTDQDNIIKIHPDTLKKTTLKVSKGITSIEPDQTTRGIAALHPAGKRYFKIDMQLKSVKPMTIDLPDGEGEVLMGMSRSGEVSLVRAGGRKLMRAGLGGLSVADVQEAKAIHPLSKGHFVVQDGEHLMTVDANGKTVSGMFDNIQATGIAKFARGWKGLTKADCSGKGWRETPPEPDEY